MKNILIVLCLCLVASQAVAESQTISTLFNKLFKKEHLPELEATPEEINAWILEFLRGAQADEFITNSTACVNATELTVGAFVYSIEGYLADKSIDNYFNVTKSVSSVTPMLKTCYDVSTDAFDAILNHFTKFTDFFQFMQYFMMNAVGNMADFKNLYDQAEADLANGDYDHIAYLAGVGVRKLFKFEPFNSLDLRQALSAEDEDLFERFWDFTMAFLEGTKVLATPNMTDCSAAWVEADRTFNTAVNMIRDGGETREAVFLVADIFGLVYPMNFNCFQGYVEAAAIIASYSSIFDSPLNIFFHLIYNFGRIYDDLAAAVAAATAGDAKALGESIGDVFYILFFIE